MSEMHYEIPEDPYEAEVDPLHTKLLYYVGNEIIKQRVASKRVRRGSNQLFMSTAMQEHEAAQLDDFFVELPHNSPTTKIEHRLRLETCTKGWFSSGRFAKHILDESDSGYPTIRLTAERERHLVSPLGKAFGSFVLRSEVSYECLGRDTLIMRQPPEAIDRYDLGLGMHYAKANDELLWEEMYPYWQNDQFNRQAISSGRFADFRLLDDGTADYLEPATIQEFGAIMTTLGRM